MFARCSRGLNGLKWAGVANDDRYGVREVDAQREQQTALLNSIYAADAIIYDPTRHSQFFTRLGLSNASPLIIGQQGTLLATLYQQGSLRGAAFGSDLFERAWQVRRRCRRRLSLNLVILILQLPYLLSQGLS